MSNQLKSGMEKNVFNLRPQEKQQRGHGSSMAGAGTYQGRSEEIQLISSGCCRIVWHKNKTRSAAVAAWWHSHSHLISSIKISDREGEGEIESGRVGDWEREESATL